MKKLFLTGLSALMLVGVAGCGTSYSEEVKAAGKDKAGNDTLIYLDGQFADWKADANFQMTATSVKAVSEFDKGIANELNKKSLEYLYVFEYEFKSEGAGWPAGYYDESGAYKEVDGNMAFKLNEGYFNAEKQIHVASVWIPNAADTDPRHVESLGGPVFVPAYNSEKDEHGLDWNSNLVNTGEAGKYKVVFAKYTTQSTVTAVGYGIGLSKVA